ncbi:MAG: hypothetical protein NTX33_11415 [Propionibacteriales bacterium]|nr:hypothetical protein [Propionibacteriales bacterium]
MHRALFKILVVLGLGLGLTFTSTPIANAGAPAADRAVRSAAAQAPDCSAKEAALDKARDNYGKRKSTLKKVRNALAKAKRAEKRAKTKKVKKARHARVVKLSKRVKSERAKVRAARAAVAIHKERVIDCRNSGTPTGPTASPIQTLCDAGVPQEICDILAGLVPGGSTASPLALLCSSAPQAAPLCDLISTGTAPDPADLLDVVNTVLVALGLGGLLDDLLGGLGLDSVLDPNDLLDLLDLLGGLLP